MTRWRIFAIVKIVNRNISTKKSDFDDIWYADAHLELDDSQWPNIFLKIQDCGRPPFKKNFFGNNSAADCPISVKFCVRKQYETDAGVRQNYFC